MSTKTETFGSVQLATDSTHALTITVTNRVTGQKRTLSLSPRETSDLFNAVTEFNGESE